LKVASVTPTGTVQNCTLPVNLKVSVVAEAGPANASIPSISIENTSTIRGVPADTRAFVRQNQCVTAPIRDSLL
jgi:hypothetical protein